MILRDILGKGHFLPTHCSPVNMNKAGIPGGTIVDAGLEVKVQTRGIFNPHRLFLKTQRLLIPWYIPPLHPLAGPPTSTSPSRIGMDMSTSQGAQSVNASSAREFPSKQKADPTLFVILYAAGT